MIPNFCVDVRGSKCRPKIFYYREMKTPGHDYHPDLELSDRSREKTRDENTRTWLSPRLRVE